MGDMRAWFDAAATGWRRVVEGIDDELLGDPGLGEWTVRDLLGHSCRAFTTMSAYLAQPVEEPGVRVGSTTGYLRAALGGSPDHGAIAERGRDAGAALGPDPVGEALAIGDRVGRVVAATADDREIGTPVGTMRFVDYLGTRAFELTVHAVDLARATGQVVPKETAWAARRALVIVTELLDEQSAVQVLEALTGRGELRPEFSVL